MGLGSRFKETKDKGITKCPKNLVEHPNNHIKGPNVFMLDPNLHFKHMIKDKGQILHY